MQVQQKGREVTTGHPFWLCWGQLRSGFSEKKISVNKEIISALNASPFLIASFFIIIYFTSLHLSCCSRDLQYSVAYGIITCRMWDLVP